MAEHADGSIIVDTEIDSSGFKSGSAELKSAVKSLTRQVSGLGPTLQKAVSGNTKAMGTFEAKASALKSKISDLEAKMAKLGNTRLPTEDYKFFSLELEKAQKQLAKLEAREAKMGALGIKEKSAAYKSLQYDITLTKEKIMDLEATLAGMRQNGTAFQMGSATAEYQQMASSLAAAKQQMAEMDAAAASAAANASALPSVGSRIAAAFAKAGAVIKSAVVSGLRMAAKAARTLLTYTLKAATGMNKLGKSSTRTGRGFGSMIKSMLFFTAFRAVLTGIKEGIDALALSSGSFNDTMSQLKTSMAQLRNSFITAFAPILSVVVPILSTLISKLAQAITYIGQFFAALTGAKTFTKAITKQQDYAASLKDTAGAAKEAKRQLAGFDELNVLSDNSGGGGGADDTGVEFEDVPIDSGIANIAAKIKEAFTNGDFYEIGKIVAEGLNIVVQKVYDVLTGIDWEGIGVAFGEGLNGFVHNVDWDLLGRTIGAYFMAKLNLIYGFISTFDWAGAGRALGTCLMGLWNSIDWAKAGRTLSTAVIGVLNFISEGIKTIDWQKVGNDVALFVASIDWTGMVFALADGIGAALGGLTAAVVGFLQPAWESVVDWWYDSAYEDGEFTITGLLQGIGTGLVGIGTWIWDNIIVPFCDGFDSASGGMLTALCETLQGVWQSLVDWWYDVAYEDGQFTMEGLLLGIWEVIKNIGKWINDNIFKPFIKGFCEAFGISSPSKVMKEHGVYLVEGLLLGITDTWKEITSFFKNAISSIGSTLSNGWNSIKTTASTAHKNISSALQTTWNTIKSNVSSSLNNIKSTASSAWNNIKSTVSSASSNIQSSISSCWNNAASRIRSSLSSISSSMSSTFNSLKSNTYTWGSHICDNLYNGIKNGISKVVSAASSLASSIRSYIGFSEPEKGPLSDFHTYMPDMIDLMVKGINDNKSRAVGAISGVAAAISDEVQNGDYGTVGISTEAQVSSSLEGFGDTIANSFAELMNRLQAIANGVSFIAPNVVNGVTPYSVSAAQNGSRGSSDASNNEDIGSVVIQSVNNATVAIVKAIEEYSQTNVSIDSQSLADSIISEINRRTKMSGKSPLLT